MQNLVYFFLGVSGLTALAVYIGKLIISKTFDLGIEKYKNSLQKDLEEHKGELSKITLEHQVKFSKLHEDRAEKIKILYGKVIDLEQALIYATTIAQGPEYITDTQRDQDCVMQLRELIANLDINRIFFTADTIAKFDKMINESWEIIAQMRKVRAYGSAANQSAISGRPIPEVYLSGSDLWTEAFNRTQREFKVLKEELANEFRILLGI